MNQSGNRWKDSLGIATSVLCAVHCAATPILIAFLPTLQFTRWMASPLFHQIAAAVCVTIAGLALLPSIRRHRDHRITSLAGTGLSLILLAAFVLPDTCCTSSICEQEEGGLFLLSHEGHSHDGHSHTHSGSDPFGSKLDHIDTHAHDQRHTNAAAGENVVSLASFGNLSWGEIQPWLTPIGGLLLIAAHILNMGRIAKRCGASCRCEKVEPVLVIEEATAQAA